MSFNLQNASPRLLAPSDLIGALEAARILGITRPSLTRRVVAGGKPEPVAKLDGLRGPYVFDRNDVVAAAAAKC